MPRSPSSSFGFTQILKDVPSLQGDLHIDQLSILSPEDYVLVHRRGDQLPSAAGYIKARPKRPDGTAVPVVDADGSIELRQLAITDDFAEGHCGEFSLVKEFRKASQLV